MLCKSCNNEFDNIHGLKFCPYCGSKIEEMLTEEPKEKSSDDEFAEEKKTNGVEDGKKLNDTLKMPAITEEDIERYNNKVKKETSKKSNGRFVNFVKKPFKHVKATISVITVILLIGLGVGGYIFLSNKTVDETRIKEDLLGRIITLPKGTKVEIKKGYIKSLTINSRNTDKNAGKDDIKTVIDINNGTVEVNTLLSMEYVNKGKNKWELADKLQLEGDTSVKPVIGMEETQFLGELKKQTIALGNAQKALGDDDVKSLQLVERVPAFGQLKEDIVVVASIDNGLTAASGKLKCSLAFQDEAWSITKVDKSSDDDFKLALSPNFSQDRISDAVKAAGMDDTVTNSSIFGGKSFYVKDSFTKNITISNKTFDDSKGTLTVTAKRENSAGELNTVLLTDYTFNLALNKLDLLKKSKTTVDSVAVNEISRDLIVSTISNVAVEGSNIFFWFPDNHKITADEAKTFKSDKISSKKGIANVKYVFGTITYADNSKKAKAIVATYYLVYDSSKGYSWKLDKIVGEDSPNYKSYTQ